MKIRHGAAVGIGLVAIIAGVLPAAASAAPGGAHAAMPASAADRVHPAELAASRLPGELTGPRLEPGALSGTVLGAHSAPLAGACVTATGPAASFTAPTRADGRFLLTGLPPGRYVLEYRDCSAPSRYFAQWSGGAGSPEAATALVVLAGHQRTLPPVTLRPTNPATLMQARPAWQRRPARNAAVGSTHTGAISGVVTGRGRALRGICVLETGANDSGFGTTTSRTGHYTIRRVPAGRVTVQFSTGFGCSNHGNWLTQWYRQINTPFFPDRPTRVRVRAGHTTKGINGRLKLGGEISGTVTSASGQKLPGICVNATGRVHSHRIGLAIRTSSSGRYSFHGLFAGSYTVSFSPGCGNNGNFLPQSWRHVGPRGHPTPIRITGDRVVTRVNASLKPGAIITGKVRLGSKTGQPLRGICVSTENEFIFASAVTRKDGSYRLAGLSTGKYRVLFQPCNNGNFTTKLSQPVSVRGGRTTMLLGILQPGATISGMVTDTSGSPVPGICIQLQGPSSGSAGVFEPVTGKSGDYSIRQLSRGRYELQFSGGCGSKGSFAPQNYRNQADLAIADPIAVKTGQHRSGINAVMQPGATISGRVRNTAGRSLNGVCVAATTPAFAESGSDVFATFPAGTANGRYRLTDLTPGQYELAFGGCGPGDFAEQWYRAQPGISTATLLSAAAGRPVTGIDAVMHPGGAISGTVTDPAGHKLSNVCVTARNIRTGVQTEEDQSITDDGGYFIGALPAGRYQVQFIECGFRNFRPQWYRGQGRSAATPVTVTGGDTTRNIDARLRPGGIITGTVTGSAGQPLRNICVVAFNAMTESFGTSGKNGRYAVPDLITGRYHLEFDPCSFGSSLASVIRPASVRVVAPRTVSGINAHLAAGGAVSGAVLTASPSGRAAGECAEAEPVSQDNVGRSALSGRNGAYTIRGLAPGQYRVFFGDQLCSFGGPALATQWYDGQQTRATATIITVTAGHTTSGIGATLLSGGTISGTVTSASAAGLSGACVIAQRQAARSQPVQAVTDAAGSYTLIDLPPGKYTVKFTSGCGLTGFATQWWHDASSAASATAIAVRAGTSEDGIDAVLRQAPG
jgi:hypothetical protein